MREQYRCPVEGCEKVYSRAKELQAHMAGMMQYDDDHKWKNVPVSHTDLEAAKEKVMGVDDY